jgi:hypothetical protein
MTTARDSRCDICGASAPTGGLTCAPVVTAVLGPVTVSWPQWPLCGDCVESVQTGNEDLVRFNARVVTSERGPRDAAAAETRALARYDQLREELQHGARLIHA